MTSRSLSYLAHPRTCGHLGGLRTIFLGDRIPASGGTEIFDFPGAESQIMSLGDGVTSSSLPAFWTSTLYDVVEDGVVGADRRSGRVWRWTWDGSDFSLEEAPETTYVSDWELDLLEARLVEHRERLLRLGHDPEVSEQSTTDRSGRR